MAGKISRGVTVKGAIAYQDDSDPTQFHYFPSAPKLTLEDNLEAFSVKYWGIGDRYYIENATTGEIFSSVGATMSGQVIFDCAIPQKEALKKEIKAAYGIDQPKLLPLSLANVKVVPVFAGKTLGISSDGEATFPTEVQIGSSLVYNVANGQGKFAQLFANSVAAGGAGTVANPDFALQIYGDAELVADPWVVEIEAELSQVWEFTRLQFGVEAKIGWFDMSSQFEKIMQDLQKKQIVKIKYIEGSLDNKDQGLQLFEQGKLIFEQLNKQISAGEGLFKLDPNPTPPPPPKGGGSVLPWSLSINASYQASTFTQKVTYKNTLEYLGRTLRRMPSSIVLAVGCGGDNKKYFYDLLDPENPCITPAKMKKLQDRLKVEKEAQNLVVKKGSKDLEKGVIDLPVYNKVLDYLQNNSVTEDIDTESGARLQLGAFGQQTRLKTYHRKSTDYQEILKRLH